MNTPEADARAIHLLRESKRIAVVGLDSRTNRPAYQIARYLQDHGYRIIPVHRGRFPSSRVLGESAYETLREIPEPVDLVDVFVRSEETGPVIDDAIAIGAKGVWLQLGISNREGVRRAREAGLMATQDRCTMIEHQRVTFGDSGQPG